ncbi:transporter substrate-binding domain-containing protein [Pseudomonas capeferrum]|nr:transporter substrate-binding domain-containing protein [Pseudomonas capeferrum]
MILYLTLLLIGVNAYAQHTDSDVEHFALLNRADAEQARLSLTAPQQRWLDNRKQLLLGVSAPDYPPFDITSGGRDYQGLTADYAGLIGAALGLPVKVLRFPTRQAAVAALRRGEIDLLGSANGFEAAIDGLALSRPYAIDQPVLVTREDETRSLDKGLEGMRLSTLYHYLPPEEVRANYPKATLLTFPSYTNALNAVAFEQADVFIGDTISTYYHMNQGHLPNLKMANFGKHERVGFSFATRQEDRMLLELVDATLDSLSSVARKDIFKRWSAGSDKLLTDRKLQLSPREERWLLDHPILRVVVNETAAPMTFFDNDGNFRGIAADLLELIRLRTGLRYEVQRARGVHEMINRIRNDKADLIASIASTERHAEQLSISRPYLENSYVLVSRTGADQPTSLEELSGHRVAMTRDNILGQMLSTQHPQIQQVVTESTFHAMALLTSGQVDATITTLIDANFAIASHGGLAIRTTVGDEPAAFSLASARQAEPLASIIDKALLSISPQDLGVINSRWRGYSAHDDAYWQTYQRLILQVVIGTGLLLLLCVGWNARLRRQIKHRHAAERALNDQLAFMRALLNGTPHPMYVRDREGCMQSCNDAYLEAVQASSEAVIGRRLEDSTLSDCDYTRQIQADYLKVMTQGTPLIIDRPLRLKDRELTIYHWILPYRNSLGEMQGIIGGWIDISERRKLVQDLRLAKQQADDANRAKSTFLATISHEIRTPMNAVIGMLELSLKHAEQGRIDRSVIEVAHQSAKDLQGLIGDILDIVRIESGHIALCPEPIALADLVRSVGRVFEGLARQKSLALEIVISPAAHCHALLDPLRFKQVLSNLLSNAIKFTEHGQVGIHMDLRDLDDSARPTLVLEVRDSGIGIRQSDLQRLFSPFVQADPTSTAAQAGTGLGLVISRALCQMMGGVLTLESLHGVGTRVSLRMPLHIVDAPPSSLSETPRIPYPDSRLRVLVIDDHPANLLLMGQQLGYLGVEHDSARDGQEGLQKWREGAFDVLIVDCNMPLLDGYQLTERVRMEERQRGLSHCVVLGYTANALPEVRQRCRDAGMDDCLLKPVDLQTLGRRLAALPCPERLKPQLHAPFDLKGLAAIVGDSREDRKRLLETLHTSLRHDLEQLMAIDPDTEPSRLGEQAHKILSAARVLEARVLIRACETLEGGASTLPAAMLRLRRQELARHMRRVENALQRELACRSRHDRQAS